MKSRKKRKYNLVDRISVLPDEILVTIVSFLSVKEAAATSVLAKRWRNVWKSTSTLDFQDIDFFAGSQFRNFISKTGPERHRRSIKYVEWVNRVLKEHEDQSIEKFRTCFFLDRKFQSSIDKWIEFAIEKRVQLLELQFLVPKFSYTQLNYWFPSKLIQGNNAIGFKCLRVLLLQQINLTGEILDYFLTSCPALERLSLVAASGLVRLRVSGPTTALKYLLIKHCPGLEDIEICDSNTIASFYFRGHRTNLLLRNVPSLVELHIVMRRPNNFCTMSALLQKSSCLHQIRTLTLDTLMTKNMPKQIALPTFGNLRHLELFVDTKYGYAAHYLTSCFMNACPFLERFALLFTYRFSEGGYFLVDEENIHYKTHRHLKILELVGWRDQGDAPIYINYIIKNAVSLTKIIIDPVRRWFLNRNINRKRKTVDRERDAIDFLSKFVEVPSNVEFVHL